MKNIASFKEGDGKIKFELAFDDAQSYFVVFRNKYAQPKYGIEQSSPSQREILNLTGTWEVLFDSAWGGPVKPLIINQLEDWTKNPDAGIKYYSGTAVYKTTFDFDMRHKGDSRSPLYLDLGIVKHIASVTLNGKKLGVLWTAPWTIEISEGLLKTKNNRLIIEVSNVWANRLIGDEQESDDCEWLKGQMGDYLPGHKAGRYLKEFPDWFVKKQRRPSAGRYCFTTWKYFTKDSPLISSGLLGPVKIMTVRNK